MDFTSLFTLNAFIIISILQSSCYSVFVTNSMNDISFDNNNTNNNPMSTVEINYFSNVLTTVNDKLINSSIIPICCPSGYIVSKSNCLKVTKISTNVSEDEDVNNNDIELKFPQIYTYDLKVSDKKWESIFKKKKYGIPCENGLYALNPDSPDYDIFYLLENGTIYQNNTLFGVPDAWLNVNDYCLANIQRENETYSVVAVCLPNSYDKEIPFTYRIGILLSIPFFAVTFLVYALLPELKNIHGITLMAYVGSLFIAYVTLAVVQIGDCAISNIRSLCISFAFVIHFSFLASFFWLNVMCFDIWWTFGGFRALQGSIKQRERKKFIIYSSYAWGCAGILTGICLIMDFHPSIPSSFIRPQFGEQSCWFTTDAAKAIYFYGPMGMTVICNIILFISTAIKIVNHKKETAHHLKGIDSHRHDDNKQWFNLYLKLFIVMGINWSMEIISWLCKDAPDYVWYVTDIANTLQGLIIFIIFVWKDKIKRLLLKRFGCKDSRFFQSRNSTRSGYHSSMSTRTNTSTLTPLQDKFKSTNSVEKNIADDQTDAF
ncbi:G-protein coupled receptor Mth2 isoform X2 [Microplitis demolitor]|uniref:G-protein coupled receptor Mth2 isoform X2 n=1 Tax=Microplitis demolitor TaxID=69319 RepID=UPI0004CD1E99|nr:G-protein coupled receptor Mth2 isoform X2 [Microplitis demolitor]